MYKRNKSKKLAIKKSIPSIEECTNFIAKSEYWIKLLHTIKELFNGSSPCSILCYGLGNFMNNIYSRYQLGFLLTIKNEFKVNCDIYDPKFTAAEQAYLSEIGLNLIDHDEDGKRSLLPYTFVFMPHCPIKLLNNLLWANWKKDFLTNCVLFCNSIGQTIATLPDYILNKYANYIKKISPYVLEELCENFIYGSIFNDMSLHIFPNENIKDLENTFWEQNSDSSDEFKKLQMIVKFNYMSFKSEK